MGNGDEHPQRMDLPEGEGAPVPELIWQSCDGMMIINEYRKILAVNPALEQLTGRSAKELVGQAECGILFGCRSLDGSSLEENPWDCPGLKSMQEFHPVQGAEYAIRGVGGKTIIVSASYTPIQLPGRPVWALVIFRDISQTKKEQTRWIEMALTDPLTRLPNRTAFLDACRRETNRAQRTGRPFAIALADLDRFKRYNDTYGHLAGDELLQGIAQLLQNASRASDGVARYGGDEFILLLPETDLAGAEVVIDRIGQAIARFPFRRPAASAAVGELSIGVSFGVAAFPKEGTALEALIAQADQRLYEAKRNGVRSEIL